MKSACRDRRLLLCALGLIFVSKRSHIEVKAFVPPSAAGGIYSSNYSAVSTSSTAKFNWLGDLWEEIIEFSTYGPSERRMIKARRQEEAALKEQQQARDDMTISFREAKQKLEEESSSQISQAATIRSRDESLSIEAFQAATASAGIKKETEPQAECPMDGYQLRDLIVSKWKVPVDIDFERVGGQVFITALPVVGYGTRFSRHMTELDYLMHLQAIAEILHRYDNLDRWVAFVEMTNAVPKPGTQSVPLRLDLSAKDLEQIFG